MSSLEKEQEMIRAAVIKYVKEAYRASVNTRVPSLRGEICKHVKDKLGIPCYPDKLQPCFPPELDGPGRLMKRICKASAVRYPRERVRLAKKAITGKKKHAKKKGGKKKLVKRDVAAVTEVQETARQPGSIEDLQRSIEMETEQRRYRKERAEEKAEEIKLLALDSREEISGPILNAIENTVLPVLLEKKYGVEATVPEILEMLKQYKKAVDEGWCVEYAMEWGVLSEKDRETFREICNTNTGGTIGLPDYLSTLKDEVAGLISQKNRLLEEVNEIQQKKRTLEFYYSQLKTQCDSLKKNCEERKKRLDDEYYELAKDYGYRFATVKRQLQDEISKLIKQRDKLSLTMINKKLGDQYNPVKRLNPKLSYHGEIDFKKMWESLGFSVSEQKKKTVA